MPCPMQVGRKSARPRGGCRASGRLPRCASEPLAETLTWVAGSWSVPELNRGPLALLRKLESLLNVSDSAPANATGKHTMETEDE